MKTMIVGDLHHGRKHNCTYGDSSIWDYKSLSILNRLINEHEPRTLILCGDIFDNSKPTALAFAELITVLVRVPNVWIIAGNHDISKVTEDIAFDQLEALENIFLVKASETATNKNFHFIGWQPTQTHYIAKMTETIAQAQAGDTIITHASRIDFGNEMDNIMTDELLTLAKEKDVLIVSGHEHTSSVSKHFIHLGSVVPHTIAELGPRYYLLDGTLLQVPDDGDIILTREEPLHIDPDKCYYVKTGKEVTAEDLKLEAKDLNVDIIDSFWKEAEKQGFDKRILND